MPQLHIPRLFGTASQQQRSRDNPIMSPQRLRLTIILPTQRDASCQCLSFGMGHGPAEHIRVVSDGACHGACCTHRIWGGADAGRLDLSRLAGRRSGQVGAKLNQGSAVRRAVHHLVRTQQSGMRSK